MSIINLTLTLAMINIPIDLNRKKYEMLHLKENCCFLCSREGSCNGHTYVDIHKLDYHQSCWLARFGIDKIADESYTDREWISLTGHEYNTGYVLYELNNGSKYWYKGSNLHRLDGPAKIETHQGGESTYFIEGEYILEENFKNMVQDYLTAPTK